MNLSTWNLIYTKPRQELIAKRNLENQGIEVFLPMIADNQDLQNEKFKINPLFPRYLFINNSSKNIPFISINSTRGVNHIVRFGNKIATIPIDLINGIKSCLNNNNIFFQKTTLRDYEPGEKLQIKKGLFKGLEAIFLAKKGIYESVLNRF